MNGEVLPLRRVIAIDGVLHTTFPRYQVVKSDGEKTVAPRTRVIEHLWPFKKAANDSSIFKQN